MTKTPLCPKSLGPCSLAAFLITGAWSASAVANDDNLAAIKADIARHEAEAKQWEEKRRAEAKEWDEKVKKRIEECQKLPAPTLGMTREEVAASRWGRPWDEIETITVAGTTHQWVYKGYLTHNECSHTMGDNKLRFLFFRDGRLVAIEH